LRWDKTSKSVVLRVRHIKDYSGNFYDYDVSLNVGDIRGIMDSLAEQGIGDCETEISEAFSPKLDKLLKIMMCSVGLVSRDDAKKETQSSPSGKTKETGQ
jgi:hypothetical protein